MRRVVTLIALAAFAGACHKPPPEDTCRAPSLSTGAAPGYASEKQDAVNCVKQAAFALTRAGGPLAGVPAAALSQCADAEKAIGKSGETLYDWQRKDLHESLLHTALVTAVQARSTGCGRPPGAQPDS